MVDTFYQAINADELQLMFEKYAALAAKVCCCAKVYRQVKAIRLRHSAEQAGCLLAFY